MNLNVQIRNKRLGNELKKLRKDPIPWAETLPDEKDQLVWYFMIIGPDDSDFKNGKYIGKIQHSPNYPEGAPDFFFFTPNGRFDTGKKICLSNSGYHQSEWTCAWNVRTMIIGIMSIMLDDKEHGISHICRSKAEREMLAIQSDQYNRTHHKDIYETMLELMDQRQLTKESVVAKTSEPSPQVEMVLMSLQQQVAKTSEPSPQVANTDTTKRESKGEIDDLHISAQEMDDLLGIEKKKSGKVRNETASGKHDPLKKSQLTLKLYDVDVTREQEEINKLDSEVNDSVENMMNLVSQKKEKKLKRVVTRKTK